MQSPKLTSLLIVDDDEDLREIITLSCHGLPLQTIAVASAEEALKLLEQASFDVIVADLNLPKITGLDLYLRLSEKSIMTRFVLMTGNKDHVHELNGLDLAVDTILLKPFSMKQFTVLMEELITDKKRDSLMAMNA